MVARLGPQHPAWGALGTVPGGRLAPLSCGWGHEEIGRLSWAPLLGHLPQSSGGLSPQRRLPFRPREAGGHSTAGTTSGQHACLGPERKTRLLWVVLRAGVVPGLGSVKR